jgi:hypothetical protein
VAGGHKVDARQRKDAPRRSGGEHRGGRQWSVTLPCRATKAPGLRRLWDEHGAARDPRTHGVVTELLVEAAFADVE